MAEICLFTLFIFLFLAGMAVLRIGLFNLSGDKLKVFLEKMTDRPWKGFLTGTLFTGILQSSSAVMVMTVGLVSSGSMTFAQSIGIILGTNIGSALTVEFMTFTLERWILPMIIIGAVLSFSYKTWIKSLGISLIGISAVFAAIGGFKMLASSVTALPAVQVLLQHIEGHALIALLTGILLTALIHSSSATIGISMSLLLSGDLTLPSAILIMLGSNVGTCITGYMAGIGSGMEAKFTAYAHIWLNILGVLAFLPFIDAFSEFAVWLTADKMAQLAHASLIFNLGTSLAVLPFARSFAKLILLIHHRK
ncbi:Na/Pi symporter [Bacillus massiliglaciei]|uniref:Na/Pi symporter n=1 Tax=Bacillus massiliglaciei TaxID=1816693 RepID=UPI000AD9BED9|nr:Na/Pi symporter [Bacillus massiliglaciei]